MTKEPRFSKEDNELFGTRVLHGSRAMSVRAWPPHSLPEGTDWDYAAQHKQPWEPLVRKAVQQGWVEVVDKSYMDNDTAFVFEKVIDGQKVQVSLRQNLQRYSHCFNSLQQDFYFKYLWKGSDNCFDVTRRRSFFNTLYDVWDAGDFR